MKTSTRITTLLSVFLFALVASAEFVYQVSFEANAAPTLMFGISKEKAIVPYPPYGTPADGAINHIFFVGSGDAASPQATDFGQLACSYYNGKDSDKVVWQLQSISDAQVYFKLANGTAPSSLTIDDGEADPVAIDENPVAVEKGKTYFIRANGATIKPIGTLEVSVIRSNPSFSFKEPYPEGYEITPSKTIYAFKEDGTAVDNNIKLTSNNGVINVANFPADAAYFQYGFDYKVGSEKMSSVVVVEVTDSVSTKLTGIAYAAYDGQGAIAKDDEEQEIKGDADPASTKVFNVPTSDDAKTVYLTFTYGIATAAAANEAALAVGFLPVTDQYEVVTDAASPAGATKIEYDNTSINATKANDGFEFAGLNLPANSTATLTLVLKLGADAAQANVLPELLINNESLDLTAVYVNPTGTSGTLDFDNDGDIDNDDAMYLYNFVLSGCPLDDWFTAESILGFTNLDATNADDMAKAETALACMRKNLAMLDFDGDGDNDNDDAMYVYNFVLSGCPMEDWFTAESILGFTNLDAGNADDMAKAETALNSLRKLAAKTSGN